MPDSKEALLLRNLIDAGCDDHTIERFLQYRTEGKVKEQKRLLSRHKASLLEKVHDNQRKIDCLDFLLFRMEEAVSRRKAETDAVNP